MQQSNRNMCIFFFLCILHTPPSFLSAKRHQPAGYMDDSCLLCLQGKEYSCLYHCTKGAGRLKCHITVSAVRIVGLRNYDNDPS